MRKAEILQITEAIVLEQDFPLRTAVRLEIITIIWMVIEAVVAIGAGIAASSLLLVAFGIDSGIELASAIVVFRRFRFELSEKLDSDLGAMSDIERRTARITGYLLLLLSAYVVVQAIFGLMTRHAAETSPIGIAVAIGSIRLLRSPSFRCSYAKDTKQFPIEAAPLAADPRSGKALNQEKRRLAFEDDIGVVPILMSTEMQGS